MSNVEKTSPINIHTASSLELQKVPGIGPKRAASIIRIRGNDGNELSMTNLVSVTDISQHDWAHLHKLGQIILNFPPEDLVLEEEVEEEHGRFQMQMQMQEKDEEVRKLRALLEKQTSEKEKMQEDLRDEKSYRESAERQVREKESDINKLHNEHRELEMRYHTRLEEQRVAQLDALQAVAMIRSPAMSRHSTPGSAFGKSPAYRNGKLPTPLSKKSLFTESDNRDKPDFGKLGKSPFEKASEAKSRDEQDGKMDYAGAPEQKEQANGLAPEKKESREGESTEDFVHRMSTNGGVLDSIQNNYGGPPKHLSQIDPTKVPGPLQPEVSNVKQEAQIVRSKIPQIKQEPHFSLPPLVTRMKSPPPDIPEEDTQELVSMSRERPTKMNTKEMVPRVKGSNRTQPVTIPMTRQNMVHNTKPSGMNTPQLLPDEQFSRKPYPPVQHQAGIPQTVRQMQSGQNPGQGELRVMPDQHVQDDRSPQPHLPGISPIPMPNNMDPRILNRLMAQQAETMEQQRQAMELQRQDLEQRMNENTQVFQHIANNLVQQLRHPPAVPQEQEPGDPLDEAPDASPPRGRPRERHDPLQPRNPRNGRRDGVIQREFRRRRDDSRSDGHTSEDYSDDETPPEMDNRHGRNRPGRRRPKSPPAPKMPTFHGTPKKWRSFISNFKDMSIRYEWSEKERRLNLLALLRDRAVEFKDNLPRAVVADYRSLKKALHDRFGSTEEPKSIRRHLWTWRQNDEETVDEFADRTYRQCMDAFPKANSEMLDILSVEYFLGGIKDKAASFSAMDKEPSNLYKALKQVKVAMANLKAVGKSYQSRQVTFEDEVCVRQVKPPAPNSASEKDDRIAKLEETVAQLLKQCQTPISSPSRTGKCYTCGDPTHYSNACPTKKGLSPNRSRSVSPSSPRKCYSCGETGHFKRECPRKKSETGDVSNPGRASPSNTDRKSLNA